MFGLFTLLHFASLIVVIVFIIKLIVRKVKGNEIGNFKTIIFISLIVWVGSFIVMAITVPKTDNTSNSVATIEDADNEIEAPTADSTEQVELETVEESVMSDIEDKPDSNPMELSDYQEENIESQQTTQTEDDSKLDEQESEIVSDDINIELDELQLLFCDLVSFENRNDVYNFVKENDYYVHWFSGDHHNASSCYVGMTSKSVSSRPRDREGAVINIEFEHDGSIKRFGYTIGGSAAFFSDFELTYENGYFCYAGETFEDGEPAMQNYLKDKV